MAVDLLKLEEVDEERLELLETIELNTKRGAEMVRQVLSFARGVQGRRTEVNASHLVTEVMRIVRDTFPKSIVGKSRISPNLPLLHADPTQIHQVLLNLCVNARDAMPTGGRLTLAAESFTVDSVYAAVSPDAKQGKYVRLEVQDTGTGIAAEFLDQIFDPFFTSKEVGKGTGLGLSTSLAIVKSHGGFLRVYTEPGRGTSFAVFLPASTGLEEQHEMAQADPALPRGNGELVLVVDDEAAIRQITGATLQAFGYRALLAAEGTEAVTLYVAHQNEIALVLTDMMMPVLDGAATARVLARLNPKVRIIAASGIPTNHQADPGLAQLIRRFLPKPYTTEMLLQALKEVLAQKD
jgi:CheY-like chemotaxis protein